MKIAVMGAGGLGGYLGGMLARAGEDVVLIARGPHLQAIRQRGLRLRSENGEAFTVQPEAVADPVKLGVVDLLLFCVKSYDLDDAARQIRPMVGNRTVILPVQNGVEAWDRISSHSDAGILLGGVSYLASHLSTPGEIVYGGVAGKLWLGEYRDKATGQVGEILGVLRRAGVDSDRHPQIHRLLWEKFVMVCATGGVMALMRMSMGSVLKSPEAMELCRGVMNESEALGRNRGVDLPEGLSDRLVEFFKERIQPQTRSSMLVDLLAGRRLELDSLNGAVVRMGKNAGIPTPFNLEVYETLKPYINGSPAR